MQRKRRLALSPYSSRDVSSFFTKLVRRLTWTCFLGVTTKRFDETPHLKPGVVGLLFSSVCIYGAVEDRTGASPVRKYGSHTLKWQCILVSTQFSVYVISSSSRPRKLQRRGRSFYPLYFVRKTVRSYLTLQVRFIEVRWSLRRPSRCFVIYYLFIHDLWIRHVPWFYSWTILVSLYVVSRRELPPLSGLWRLIDMYCRIPTGHSLSTERLSVMGKRADSLATKTSSWFTDTQKDSPTHSTKCRDPLLK